MSMGRILPFAPIDFKSVDFDSLSVGAMRTHPKVTLGPLVVSAPWVCALNQLSHHKLGVVCFALITVSITELSDNMVSNHKIYILWANNILKFNSLEIRTMGNSKLILFQQTNWTASCSWMLCRGSKLVDKSMVGSYRREMSMQDASLFHLAAFSYPAKQGNETLAGAGSEGGVG